MEMLKNIIFSKALLFSTFLLLACLNLSAQYKLELGWATEPGGGGFNISSIATSVNDSLIYVAGGVYINNKSEYYIHTCKSSDGTLIRTDSTDAPFKFIMSKDGKTLAASGGWGVGMLDPQTFKRIYWEDNENSDYTTLTFNEKQNKIAICGNTSINPISSFIKVYDLEKKIVHKEFNANYFGQHSNLIKKAMITDDGKYIVYSYVSNIPNWKYYLVMIDLDGNVVKYFGETSSTQFTLTNDGKTLIYFDYLAMHFFDIETLKEKEGIPYGGANPEHIEMNLDGKFMLVGSLYCDLVNKKTFQLEGMGEVLNFILNSNNSSLYIGQAYSLYKLNLIPISSVKNNQNKLELTIQVLNDELFLRFLSELNKEYNFKIISLNGKTVKSFLPNEIQFSTNSVKINISDLLSGVYLLQASSNSDVIFSSKFIKMD